MSNLVSFDLEIYKMVPDHTSDWMEHWPLGISAAATLISDRHTPSSYGLYTSENGPMPAEFAGLLVDDLMWLSGMDYKIVGWNTAAFDFKVLAAESGRHADCVKLALQSVDLMFAVVAAKGHFLGLQKACEGMGIEGKLKKVALNNGDILEDMDGAKAPMLWQQGEYDAVIAYLKDDVRAELELAQEVAREKELRWRSHRGIPQTVFLPELPTVVECLNWPLPDTSWMNNPPSRSEMLSWMGLDIWP